MEKDVETSSILDIGSALRLLARKTKAIYSRFCQLCDMKIATDSPFRFKDVHDDS